MSVADVPHAMSRKEGRQHRGFLSRASIWVSFLLDRFEFGERSPVAQEPGRFSAAAKTGQV
ncbi:hypothetical protein ABIB75_006847 [Bradyrhizobium sp. GM2.2]|uniref:hypothetical protein n=1 Tax=unclassified Bradyrhizobium TaxID=2631580 RepID=UPI0012F9E738|nr:MULTISPECIES: hypothetical protein [unclassified Bradyrhizobium]MCK1582205.1 hypothetical protein [Bradyrhizobium sp. 168]MCK1293491.1 hypothetical protein [Bradyrhizobium sp. 30]MCK1306554.1 hypothetical protein [Bradyrhizobium sp. 45]MCK1325246.1 hypothetical protein [Bradyrhizobium sp. 156]MCK1328660.1 hypothetical protein [Bradyrhizobium sp. CW9]